MPAAAIIATGRCSAPWSRPTAADRPRGAYSCCRARTISRWIPGRCRACRGPAAGMSSSMTSVLHRNFQNLHAYAERNETPPLEERLRYKFQSTAVTERCTQLAARIFKATGAAGLSEDLPFGGILADLTAGRQHISNQYEYVGSSWGGVMFGLESRDWMV